MGHHQVACKELFTHLLEDDFSEIAAELAVLVNVHANIVRFFGISRKGAHLHA